MIFGPLARANGGAVLLNVGTGAIVGPVEYMGLLLDDTGAVYAVIDGTVNHHQNGLPFDQYGRLCVTTTVPTYYDQGLGFADGRLSATESIDGAYTNQGVKMSGGGLTVQGLEYLLNALGIATRGEQTVTTPSSSWAEDWQGVLQDFGGAVNSQGVSVTPVVGSRLSGGVVYDTDPSGNPLQPKVNGKYVYYDTYATSTSYPAGSKVSAVASDGIKRWYTSSGGTSGGSAPTFPTTIGSTVSDNDITWTYGGYHTLEGQRGEASATNLLTYTKPDATLPTDWTDFGNTGTRTLETFNGIEGINFVGASASGDRPRISQNVSLSPVTTYTLSGYVKDGSTIGAGGTRIILRAAAFTDATGDIEATLDDVVNGFVSVTFTTGTDVDGAIQYGIGIDSGTDGDVTMGGVQLEVGPSATSFIPTEATSVTRSATTISLDTADTVLSTTQGAGRSILTPNATGQTGVILSSYTDANNTLNVSATATTITLNKEVAGTTHTASKSYTHAKDTRFIVDWSYGPDGMSVNAFEVTAGAAGTDADTTAAVLGSTIEVGSENGGSRFNANYAATRFFKDATQAANTLDDWSL